MAKSYIRWLEDIGKGDVESVGGKNVSLGEMVRNLGCQGIKVPPGFAVTANGYRHFIAFNDLEPLIASQFALLAQKAASIAEVGLAIRSAIEGSEWPDDLAKAVCSAYLDLSRRLGVDGAEVAVRSSATAEDLPAGQALPANKRLS